MFFQHINYWVALIAGIMSMGLGFLWYSPIVFGKRFMKEMGVTQAMIDEHKKKDGPAAMAKMYSGPFVCALLNAFVISALLNSLVVTSIGGFVIFAFCIWMGFSMPVAVNNAIFGKDTRVLFLINTGYQLVNIILATLVIGIWG